MLEFAWIFILFLVCMYSNVLISVITIYFLQLNFIWLYRFLLPHQGIYIYLFVPVFWIICFNLFEFELLLNLLKISKICLNLLLPKVLDLAQFVLNSLYDSIDLCSQKAFPSTCLCPSFGSSSTVSSGLNDIYSQQIFKLRKVHKTIIFSCFDKYIINIMSLWAS